MSKKPSYFSSNLEFNLTNKQGCCTDRLGLKNILPVIIFGFLLFALGLYEITNGFADGNTELAPNAEIALYEPLLAVWFFDLCFIFIGLIVVLMNIANYLRYNKYQIKGSEVVIIHRRLLHGKKIIREPLENYIGIRFRVEFLQLGLLTKNRYILELYQKNYSKLVPLYISTSDREIRQKWKEYAKKFKLPILTVTDEGVKVTDYKDVNKSVAALYKQGIIKDTFDEYERLPKMLAYVRKKDKIVIKIRKIIWDTYNFVMWFVLGFAVLLFGIISFVAYISNVSSLFIYILIGTLLAIIIVLLQILFRKEKLVLKRNKIVHTYKYMFFSTKHNQIMKKDIEDVEINENPVTGRYYVSVSSDNNTIAFGAKLAIKDLRWLKRFLIHEVIK